jgi:hypothetical protein
MQVVNLNPIRILIWVGGLFAVTVLVGAYFVLLDPKNGTAATSSSESPMGGSNEFEKPETISCRVVLTDAAERREIMESYPFIKEVLRDKPTLASPRFFSNPLLGFGFGRVEIKNTSDAAVTIYSDNETQLFSISAYLMDPTDSFEPRASLSLKRFSPLPILPEMQRKLKTMKPGQVETQVINLFGGCLRKDSAIAAGNYAFRAICRYYRGGDGQDCEVQSRPFTVTVTEDDIRQWQSIWE